MQMTWNEPIPYLMFHKYFLCKIWFGFANVWLFVEKVLEIIMSDIYPKELICRLVIFFFFVQKSY